MGEQNISREGSDQDKRRFTRAVLNDLRALEMMIDRGLIESNATRIGAEQEMFIVDKDYGPQCAAPAMLEEIEDPRFTNEIAQFNIEANLSPQLFTGDCLRRMEEETKEVLSIARQHAQAHQSNIVLAGILPTLRQMDLTLENMTPADRYFELNDRLKALKGSDFRLDIRGVDELSVTHDNFLLEAMNTSFQVHFQVSGDAFVNMYNLSQAITAPVLASAVNSSLIHHFRLWHESRIAVFQNSVDTRSETHQGRGNYPRVQFGNEWINSIVDVFREDISHFPVVLTTDFEEDPVAMVEQGIIPKLRALMLHNGTVYRWNRPCYGVKDNIAHLRIENRVLPAGPSVVDEIANAAFYFGLMTGMSQGNFDVAEKMRFTDARNNFRKTCRIGLEAQFNWFGGDSISARDLIRQELLPQAEQGLKSAGIDAQDIERYLNLIDARVVKGQTGASWAIRSITEMDEEIHADEKVRGIVAEMVKQQADDTPIHLWPLATVSESLDWRASFARLGQFMTTKLLTVQADDSIDLAASIMEWKHVRHVPVENEHGELIGLVSHRSILKHIVQGKAFNDQTAISEIMNDNPTFVHPEMPTVEAIQLMRDKKLSCLPVVSKGKLVGVVTDYDLIKIASKLLQDKLSEYEAKESAKTEES